MKANSCIVAFIGPITRLACPSRFSPPPFAQTRTTPPAFPFSAPPSCSPADTLLSVEADKRNSYYVARIAVQDLHRLGLTVVPEPRPDGPPGHAIIPGLSWQAYQADKRRLKQVQVELAK